MLMLKFIFKLDTLASFVFFFCSTETVRELGVNSKQDIIESCVRLFEPRTTKNGVHMWRQRVAITIESAQHAYGNFIRTIDPQNFTISRDILCCRCCWAIWFISLATSQIHFPIICANNLHVHREHIKRTERMTSWITAPIYFRFDKFIGVTIVDIRCDISAQSFGWSTYMSIYSGCYKRSSEEQQ